MENEEDKTNRANFPNIVVNQVNVITNDSNTNQQESNHHHVEINQTGNNAVNIIMNFDTTEEDGEEFSNTPSGEYCDSNCIHYREEYLDDGGGLVAEATGNVDRYCDLRHSLGGFCEDYE